MATGTFVPVEVYLRSSDYEPDAEYVHGEIEERPMAEYSHADWQQAIQRWFAQHAKDWNIRAVSEVRVQVALETFRVPDVTVLNRSFSPEQIITHAPLAVFEVLSPEDKLVTLKRKLIEYAEMGISQIWVVDPGAGTFERYESGRLTPAAHFEEGVIKFELAEIETLLQH